MIKSVLQAFPGFTINDVLNTDYGKLISTIEAKEPKEQKKEDEVMDLFDFVKSI
ncbi:hypothetical protein [Paucilactobacillus kaifaensis]|uniref:hypothetical protein n=1 Tax=Paucilactobacillus kaifaensis TaxID=2559921 RepID=UPI001485B214|nr:hypothetical protein [Paucilactobacillus kaifaensis]